MGGLLQVTLRAASTLWSYDSHRDLGPHLRDPLPLAHLHTIEQCMIAVVSDCS